MRARLEKWDAEIWDRPYVYGDTLPQIVLDSLGTIDSKRLSKNDIAYYNLILTIVSDKADVKFENDSLIVSSAEMLSNSSDNYNYARALLYKGVVRSRINPSDTSVFACIKEAQKVYEMNGYSDNKFLALVYAQLGYIHFMNKDYRKSLEYHTKQLEICTLLSDEYNILLSKCNVIWDCFAVKDFDMAEELIISIKTDETYPPELNDELFSTISHFYYQMGDYDKSIEYTKKRILMSDAHHIRTLYYTLSDRYFMLNQKDSTIKYLKLLSKSLDEYSDSNNPVYFKYISSTFDNLGYKEDALLYMNKAFAALNDYVGELSGNKVLELEKRYDIFKKEREIEKLESKLMLLWVMIISFVIILSLGSIAVFFFIKKRKEEKENNKLMRTNNELVKNILLVSCNMIPPLLLTLDNVSNTDVKYRKIVRQFNQSYRENLRTIANNTSYPYKETDSYSEQEKLVYMLLQEHYSTNEIAIILGISPDSVRSTITRIRKKG